MRFRVIKASTLLCNLPARSWAIRLIAAGSCIAHSAPSEIRSIIQARDLAEGLPCSLNLEMCNDFGQIIRGPSVRLGQPQK
jgi:hypothetical protein